MKTIVVLELVFQRISLAFVPVVLMRKCDRHVDFFRVRAGPFLPASLSLRRRILAR